MELRRLGGTGLKVTHLCLGTMAFGRWINAAAATRVLDTALDASINFLDTSNNYGRAADTGDLSLTGESEAMLGQLLGGRRQQVVLATKVYHAMGPGPNERGLSRRHLMAAVEDSLRRLQTDWIDLYQCHRFDPETPLEETLRAFDDLIRQGKVRYIGVSNWAAWQIAKAHGLSDRLGLQRFVSVQPQYSLLVRDLERELIPFCQAEGVGIIPYSPIARGLLAGKYHQGEAPPPDSRAAHGEKMLEQLFTARNFRIVEAFRAQCAAWGLPMAQVAHAWVLANPAVTSTIVGATRPEHVTDALAAAALRLSPSQKQALDALGAE